MTVNTYVEAVCDQCGKTTKKRTSTYGRPYYVDAYTPRGWISAFGKLLCGWKCVSAYALAQASKPKAEPKPRTTKPKPRARKTRRRR